LHDPTRSEERRRAASKAGKARPNREIAEIKTRLSVLAEDVLAGRADRGNAAVVSQVYNVLLRAITVELRIREQQELTERLEELETLMQHQREQQRHRGA